MAQLGNLTITAKVLLQVPGGEPVEVGTLEIPVEVSAGTPSPVLSGRVPVSAVVPASRCGCTIPRCVEAGEHVPFCRCVLPTGHEGPHASKEV